jgi:hypothetical protein
MNKSKQGAPTPLLFETDPKKFMELLMMDDAKKRLDALKTNFDDIILCEILRYGIFNDVKMIGPLAQFYEGSVVPNYAEEKRWELYRRIIGIVENVDIVSVNALLPFIAEDPSRRIVSTAVIDFVSLGPLTNNDPMSRPKDVINMIKSGQLKNRGAAFGGLLHLGDSRVCKLLWPIRSLLDKDDVKTSVNCSTGTLYSASVEFEIDWLEEVEGGKNDELFGLVASGLVLQKRNNKFDGVITGQRQFPAPKNPTPAEQEQGRELAKPISIEEYTKRIAPRLYALERSEPPPRIMPRVLSEWNLTPKTDPSEAASAPAETGAMEHIIIMDQLRSRPCKLVAAAGIVNPFGPTLAGLVLLGKAGQSEWELFSFSLNPFNQELKRLRSANLAEATHPSKLVEDTGIGLASAPTLLIFSSAPDQEVIACAKVIASAFDDLGSTVDRLQKFPGNPWDRISEEIHNGFGSLSTSPKHPRSIKPKDIDDYVAIILDRKIFSEEFAAFRKAWEGSIEFQESSGNSELVKTAMPFKELEEIIFIFVRTSEVQTRGEPQPVHH